MQEWEQLFQGEVFYFLLGLGADSLLQKKRHLSKLLTEKAGEASGSAPAATEERFGTCTVSSPRTLRSPLSPSRPFSPCRSLRSESGSCCCRCVINLACLKLIVLYLTSQSIARIPRLVPRVFSKSGTNNKSFASSLGSIFHYFISLRDRVWEGRGSKQV